MDSYNHLQQPHHHETGQLLNIKTATHKSCGCGRRSNQEIRGNSPLLLFQSCSHQGNHVGSDSIFNIVGHRSLISLRSSLLSGHRLICRPARTSRCLCSAATAERQNCPRGIRPRGDYNQVDTASLIWRHRSRPRNDPIHLQPFVASLKLNYRIGCERHRGNANDLSVCAQLCCSRLNIPPPPRSPAGEGGAQLNI